jgi:undecaprenyl-phosphate 4-deoxy-4-formamido-L-arabinose transferase
MDLSVVIPVYHAAGHLDALVAQLFPVLERSALSYEVIFVDDGSTDDSWQMLKRIQGERPERVVAVQLMRNYGQHNALMAGFRHCRGDLILTMDDDLQHPPEEIPKLLEAIRARDLDLVYGRYQSKKHPAWRNFGSNLVTRFYKLAFRSKITITSFRIMRRQLLESIFTYNLNFTFVDGLLAWNTHRIGEVLVDHQARSEGRSQYSLRKMVVLAFNLVTNFSYFPLQLVSLLGMLAAGGGFILASYYLLRAFFGTYTVEGFPSIIITILVLGGLQLMAIGIMGEYLGRLHLNMNRKPQYVERQVISGLGGGCADRAAPHAEAGTPDGRRERET